MELGFDINGVRTGGVVEKDNPGAEGNIGYSFVELNHPAKQVPIGINHRLFHEQCNDYGVCTLMRALDSGFIIPFGSGSTVTVTAHPDSSLARQWGTTTFSGVASQFEHMEFKVKIRSGIPLGRKAPPVTGFLASSLPIRNQSIRGSLHSSREVPGRAIASCCANSSRPTPDSRTLSNSAP